MKTLKNCDKTVTKEDKIANLKSFKKGDHGNPNGRPKGVKNRSTILKKWIEVTAKLKNPVTGKDEIGTVEDKVNLALITKALSGDVQAIKEINDTLYGKIPNKDELTIPEQINIIFTRNGTDNKDI